jgi:hypothetical protein
MIKIVEARILLEEFADIARQGEIVDFVEVLKNNCSVMLFDQHNLCYTLYFKEPYWNTSIELFPRLEKYYFKEEYDN